MKVFAFAAAAILVAVSPVMATTVTLNDTQTQALCTAYGGQGDWGAQYQPGVSVMPVNQWRDSAYMANLMFAKYALPADLAGATINSATLSMGTDGTGYAMQFKVWGDPGAWNQSVYNLNGAGDTTPYVYGYTNGFPGNAHGASANVTDIVQQWANGQLSGGANGFAFTANAMYNDSLSSPVGVQPYAQLIDGFLSGSAPWGRYNPAAVQLTIDYTPAPEPATMALLAVGGIGAQVRRRK